MGFSKPMSERQLTVTKRPFLDKKQNQKFQLSFFAAFFLFEQPKQKLLKPLYSSVLANLKKDKLQKANSKQGNCKKHNF